ncbi:MAG: tetratricopeptide repeat protein [bacterium]|nr:tetratricopeptide repeat protein [bacterium]
MNTGKTRNGYQRAAAALPLVLMLFFLFLGDQPGFGQKRHMMSQDEFEKFKLARRIFVRGQREYDKEKYKKAGKSLEACLEKLPKYAPADYYLARIYYEGKDYLKAVKHIENAKKNYLFMANLHVATQLEYFEKLREEKDKITAEIDRWRGKLAEMQTTSSNTEGREFQSIRSVISSLEGKINLIDGKLRTPIPSGDQVPGDYYYVHGNVLFKLRRFHDAVNQYLETVKRHPKHGNAYINLANLFFMGGRPEKAAAYLEKAEGTGIPVNPEFKKAVQKALKNKK